MKQNEELEILTIDEYEELMKTYKDTMFLMDSVVIEDDYNDEQYVLVERLG